MVAKTAGQTWSEAPLIRREDVRPLIPGFDLWDFWPVQGRDGRVVEIAGGWLFMLLSAPALPNPDDRHAIARIRLMHLVADQWRDLGPLLPDGFAPGSREWAGSAVFEPGGRTVTLYFTATGRKGEHELGFEQRMFETTARLSDGALPKLEDWSEPVECLAPDDNHYMRDMAGGGAIGTIKAFRDPAYFRDPANNREYLLFTASLAQSSSDWNGAIGIARRDGDRWQLLPPIITADALNNELERPHIVTHHSRYYLFWSTQRSVFARGGPSGPNGLYGMVADRLDGPWKPLNGTGLVLSNPASAPCQAYSWLVLPNLSVLSFADLIELGHPARDAAEARRHFGGAPAPVLRLDLRGDDAFLSNAQPNQPHNRG